MVFPLPGVDPTNSRKSKSLKWQPYKVQPKSSTTSSGHVIKDVSPLTNEYVSIFPCSFIFAQQTHHYFIINKNKLYMPPHYFVTMMF